MDKSRCRFLLRASRSNGADASDPAIAEALSLAKNDPELSAWLAREQEIDRVLTAKIREFEVPSHLRDDILSGLAMTSRRRRIPLFAVMSAAAGVAVASVFGYVALQPEPAPVETGNFDSVVASAYNNSRDMIGLTFFSASPSDLRNWLSAQSAPVPGDLPTPLASLKTIGCSQFDWHGIPASLMSFRAPGMVCDGKGHSSDRVLHLYTVEQRSCSGGSAHGEPIVFGREGRSIATWRDTTHLYVLIVEASESRLSRFLSGELVLPESTAGDPGKDDCVVCGDKHL